MVRVEVGMVRVGVAIVLAGMLVCVCVRVCACVWGVFFVVVEKYSIQLIGELHSP